MRSTEYRHSQMHPVLHRCLTVLKAPKKDLPPQNSAAENHLYGYLHGKGTRCSVYSVHLPHHCSRWSGRGLLGSVVPSTPSSLKLRFLVPATIDWLRGNNEYHA